MFSQCQKNKDTPTKPKQATSLFNAYKFCIVIQNLLTEFVLLTYGSYNMRLYDDVDTVNHDTYTSSE